MKRMSASLAFIALSAVSFASHAQFAKIEDAVRYRQSVLSVMGTHFDRIGAVVKGEKPYDKAAVETDAAIVEMMSRLPWAAFLPGSDTADSKGRPEIWNEPDKFNAASEKMQADAAKLSAAAKSGDARALRAAFGAAGQSCKACHDNFRRRR